MTRAFKNQGFTFIEIMLVIVVIAVLGALILPDLSRSIRGNRLKTASRTVVSTGKYARSLSVMRQQEMVLTFDLDAGTIAAHGFKEVGADVEDEGEAGGFDAPLPEVEDPDGSDTPSVRFSESEVERTLDRVVIELVRLGNGLDITSGQAHVLYYPNGRSDRYEVLVRDQSGDAMLIKVDSLSGVDVSKVGS